MNKPKDDEELLQHLADVIDTHYERVDHIRELDAFLDTEDIYDALQAIFPASMAYSPMDLTYALMQNGFSFCPLPGPAMQFAWLIRRRA